MHIVAKNQNFYDRQWDRARIFRPDSWASWEIINSLPKGKFLELGPGTRPKIPIKGSYFIDISKIAVKKLNKLGGVARVHSLSGKLPFKNSFFDALCAFEVLEHLPNDLEVLKESHRILKPGGIFVVSFPINMKLWNKYDETVGHIRRYNPSEVKDLFASTGFKIDSYSFINISWPGITSGLILAFITRRFSRVASMVHDLLDLLPFSGLRKEIHLKPWKDFRHQQAQKATTMLLVAVKLRI